MQGTEVDACELKGGTHFAARGNVAEQFIVNVGGNPSAREGGPHGNSRGISACTARKLDSQSAKLLDFLMAIQPVVFVRVILHSGRPKSASCPANFDNRQFVHPVEWPECDPPCWPDPAPR